MARIKLFDSTMRDGNHAVKHQLSRQNIEDYCLAMDDAGMNAIIVGHGNGLGASSLQVGLSAVSEREMLETAKNSLDKTKLGAYMIPGFGTIRDNLLPAIDAGVSLFEIGCHCTEADTTREHIEFLRSRDKEVYGVLMMYHMASAEKILEEAQKMQSYGAMGVILMDSAGASTPDMVEQVIGKLADRLSIQVGFHPHNNMGIAVANAYLAIREGATIIDGTLRGFGAGAGNCQLEELVALLEKCHIKTDANLYTMLDCSEQVMPGIMRRDMGQDSLSIISGQSGVFSAFRIPVQKAAKEFGVDARDIFRELGRRRVVAGQEDMIIEVAKQLSDSLWNTENRIRDYQINALL